MYIYYLLILNLNIFLLENQIEINKNQLNQSIIEYFSYENENFQKSIKNNIILKYNQKDLLIIFKILKIFHNNYIIKNNDSLEWFLEKILENNTHHFLELFEIIEILNEENLLLNTNQTTLEIIFNYGRENQIHEKQQLFILTKKILIALKFNKCYKNLLLEENNYIFKTHTSNYEIEIKSYILKIINFLNENIINKIENLNLLINIFKTIGLIINKSQLISENIIYLYRFTGLLKVINRSPLNNEKYENRCIEYINLIIENFQKNLNTISFRENTVYYLIYTLNALNTSLLKNHLNKYLKIYNFIVNLEFLHGKNLYELINLLNVSCIDEILVFDELLMKIFTLLNNYEISENQKIFLLKSKSTDKIFTMMNHIIKTLNETNINDYKNNKNYIKILNIIFDKDIKQIQFISNECYMKNINIFNIILKEDKLDEFNIKKHEENELIELKNLKYKLI